MPVAFLVAPFGAPIVIFLLLVPDILQNPESLPQNPIFILLLSYSFVAAYLVTLSVGI